jgi:hypothetical protein
MVVLATRKRWRSERTLTENHFTLNKQKKFVHWPSTCLALVLITILIISRSTFQIHNNKFNDSYYVKLYENSSFYTSPEYEAPSSIGFREFSNKSQWSKFSTLQCELHIKFCCLDYVRIVNVFAQYFVSNAEMNVFSYNYNTHGISERGCHKIKNLCKSYIRLRWAFIIWNNSTLIWDFYTCNYCQE